MDKNDKGTNKRKSEKRRKKKQLIEDDKINMIKKGRGRESTIKEKEKIHERGEKRKS